jgi:hypothetical protein
MRVAPTTQEESNSSRKRTSPSRNSNQHDGCPVCFEYGVVRHKNL